MTVFAELLIRQTAQADPDDQTMTGTAFFYSVTHVETAGRKRGRMWFADGQDIRAGARSAVLKLMIKPGTYHHVLWKYGDDGLERYEDATVTYELKDRSPKE